MSARRGRVIVVGVDGSSEALDAARWAGAEAARRGASVCLVAATQWAVASPVGVTALGQQSLRVALVEAAEDTLAEAAAEVRRTAPGVAVQTEVRPGAPAPVLLAESEQAELVVLGCRGLGGFAGLLAGSVTISVAASARCPVVVVRGIVGSSGPLPVVVGVDGSEKGEAALAFAFSEASARRLPLVAVHVWSDAMIDPLVAPAIDWTALAAEAEEVLGERLAGWAEKYPDVEVGRRVVRDNAAATLVEMSIGAHLVVVGSRGRGALRGALLGSVSQALLRHASCPVAVVREEES
ncbi:universal stress protein [Pseudonocardia sp. N23]|uniref:universal stress protein n=1 Tax=Pseudonocardia sp. N23 TaxID=1987376 RepID=UPI000BFC1D26|nr:universal stress protein [Pseudonocardia sp. N23]GAY07338.1 universal stress protein family [Pseudonocardia sp. N23]